VPVVLGAALLPSVPIIALHLTRPAIDIPDREALGMPSHFEAARGAYVLRPFREDQPQLGTVFIRGSVPTANLVSLLSELERSRLSVKVVAAISWQLFSLQDQAYREETITAADFFGGTSEGSPSWAAITALADQAAGHPLGELNPLLYRIYHRGRTYAADFHNIYGPGQNNAFNGPGYPATSPGYNLPTGLGTPKVANLISSLSGGL
ncbi:MAG: hypothetical protein ACYCYK_09715, partial [Candidatus Dormibacteria bacterium]